MIGEENSNVSEAVSTVIYVGLHTMTCLISIGDFILDPVAAGDASRIFLYVRGFIISSLSLIILNCDAWRDSTTVKL
jgi:hypothetical protein